MGHKEGQRKLHDASSEDKKACFGTMMYKNDACILFSI